MAYSNNWWNKKAVVLGIILASVILSEILQASADSTPLSTESASFRVTKVKLTANPIEYNGPCPTEIKFKAKISATGKGTVICQIVRSDNLPAPSITMHFDRSGTKDTTYSFHADDNLLGWQQLTVVKPNSVKSNKVEFSVMCNAQ